MKMHMMLTVEDGPAALTQVAAIQGMANSLGIPLRMQPEDDAPKKNVGWGDKAALPSGDTVAYSKAQDVMSDGSKMTRKELVRLLAKKLKKDPKPTGMLVKRWLKAGVLVEVE